MPGLELLATLLDWFTDNLIQARKVQEGKGGRNVLWKALPSAPNDLHAIGDNVLIHVNRDQGAFP